MSCQDVYFEYSGFEENRFLLRDVIRPCSPVRFRIGGSPAGKGSGYYKPRVKNTYVTQQQLTAALEKISKDVTEVVTGTPIALLIENVDQRSKDYSEIKDKYRPGHAGYTYDVKYGFHDYRGGGRASARETAARVAAGAVARKVVPGMIVRAALIQIGPHAIDRARWDWNEVARNPFFCPDAVTAALWADYLDGVRKSGSSAGATAQDHVQNSNRLAN